MRDSNQFGEELKSRREGLGLTQRSLAQKLGVEASYVGFIESGRRRLSLKLVARLGTSWVSIGKIFSPLPILKQKRLKSRQSRKCEGRRFRHASGLLKNTNSKERPWVRYLMSTTS
jgi:transcriptional regulator with XRE-family HTH domain